MTNSIFRHVLRYGARLLGVPLLTVLVMAFGSTTAFAKGQKVTVSTIVQNFPGAVGFIQCALAGGRRENVTDVTNFDCVDQPKLLTASDAETRGLIRDAVDSYHDPSCGEMAVYPTSGWRVLSNQSSTHQEAKDWTAESLRLDSQTGQCVERFTFLFITYRTTQGVVDLCCKVGNPMRQGSGEKTERIPVLTFYGPSKPLSLRAQYDSFKTTAVAGGMGLAWSHQWHRRLAASADGENVIVSRAGERGTSFRQVGGQWQPFNAIKETLTAGQLADGAQTDVWFVRSLNGLVVETYAQSDGRLLAIHQATGNKLSFSYDAQGRLDRVVDSTGRFLQFAYNEAGVLSTVTDSGERTVGFDYVTRGVDGALATLRTIRFADNSTLQYRYDDPNCPQSITEKIDEAGTSVGRYTYDAQCNGTETAGGGGLNGYAFARPNAITTQVTDPLGTTRDFQFDTKQNAARVSRISQPAVSANSPAASRTLSYDANGNLEAFTDYNGNQTTAVFDQARNVETQRTEAVGTARARTISTQWHPDWDLPIKIARPRLMTTFVYNGQSDPENGGAIANCQAALAEPIPTVGTGAVLCKRIEQGTSDPDGSQGFSATLVGQKRIWQFEYFATGEVARSFDPTGVGTNTPSLVRTEYTAVDTAATPPAYFIGDIESQTDAVGNTTTYPSYFPDGQNSNTVDPNGLRIISTYLPRGWLASRVQQGGVGGAIYSTSYIYWPFGKVRRLTEPNGSFQTFEYDAARRLVGTTNSAGERITYVLDAMGNRLREIATDAGGTVRQQTVRTFDALGRLTSQVGGGR